MNYPTTANLRLISLAMLSFILVLCFQNCGQSDPVVADTDIQIHLNDSFNEDYKVIEAGCDEDSCFFALQKQAPKGVATKGRPRTTSTHPTMEYDFVPSRAAKDEARAKKFSIRCAIQEVNQFQELVVVCPKMVETAEGFFFSIR